MKNSILEANRFISMLPGNEIPQETEGYEGFYHLLSINGSVEETVLTYIIRDHDRNLFEQRKHELKLLAKEFNATISLKDQYYNMREKVEPVMFIVNLAAEAMKSVGIVPKIKPIRGGTDGAQLSFKGLPCPNLFTGGHNFHGRYEFIPVQSMQKAVEVIVEICKETALINE